MPENIPPKNCPDNTRLIIRKDRVEIKRDYSQLLFIINNLLQKVIVFGSFIDSASLFGSEKAYSTDWTRQNLVKELLAYTGCTSSQVSNVEREDIADEVRYDLVLFSTEELQAISVLIQIQNVLFQLVFSDNHLVIGDELISDEKTVSFIKIFLVEKLTKLLRSGNKVYGELYKKVESERANGNNMNRDSIERKANLALVLYRAVFTVSHSLLRSSQEPDFDKK